MGGKVSVKVKEKYNRKTYEQVNFRLRQDGEIRRSDIEMQAKQEGKSLNAWLTEAVMEKMGILAVGSSGKTQNIESHEIVRYPDDIINITDLEAYARSAGQTVDDYIAQAIKERMQRQDAEYIEDVQHVSLDDL